MFNHFGKRKFGGSNNGSFDFYTSPKNQRLRPCHSIVYTEDAIPVRKLYFSVPSADVSSTYILNAYIIFLKFFFVLVFIYDA